MKRSATERQYASAQRSFMDWCRDRGHFDIYQPDVIAEYLQHCWNVRGASVVAVHLSAITSMGRRKFIPIDTKNELIQAVVSKARLAANWQRTIR